MSKKIQQQIKLPHDVGSFDGIANKFDKNIYGTTKGKLRHLLLCHYLHNFIHGKALHVWDCGGGTGIMSREFAQKGHNILLTDVSLDVLTIATQRLEEYQNCIIEQANLFDLSPVTDLIVCHAVLEWLDAPLDAIDHFIKVLPTGGHLSLSFFNHHAMLFSNALYGNYEYINKGLKVRNRVRLNPHNPIKPETILNHIQTKQDAELVLDAGIRCFHDYRFDRDKQADELDTLFDLEKRFGRQHPYKHLGKYYYCLIKKT